MKKTFISVFLLLLLMLCACTKASTDLQCDDASLHYENEDWGFAISLPEVWKGKYLAVNINSGVSFHHKKTYERYGGGMLFYIERLDGKLSKEDAENTPWPSHFLISSDDYTYVMNMASDMQSANFFGGNARYVKEYNEMAEGIDEIKESIRLLE